MDGFCSLAFPLDGHRLLRMGADGDCRAALCHLADVLDLPPPVDGMAAEACRSILGGSLKPGETRYQYRRMVRSGGNLQVIPIRSSRPEHECEALQLRALVCGGITLEMLMAPGDFALFHGTLIEDDDGGGTLLFGTSGIGKSTTRRRWLEEGGVSCADDAVLCFRQDGAFFARPLPTWSDWFRNTWRSRLYPVQRAVPLKRILWLSRGENDQRISDAPAARWHGQLLAAMTLHSNNMIHLFSREEKFAFMETVWGFVQQLETVFPRRVLEAHLDFPLHETLAGEGSR